MAINKNFVVKNGLEVAADVIVADATTKNVGVGTTVGRLTLDVRGSIGATDLSVTGIGTIVTINNTFLTSTSGNITNLTGTSGTITTLNSTNGNVTNLTGTAATIGVVKISTGIITATSGVVTYYGDGSQLDLSNNSSTGIGIGTAGGLVGYGATFINFFGAGVSTALYNSSVGIATIYFQGGGGGASIGVGSTPGDAGFGVGVATDGNLWYNTDLGRLFIYYQDNDSAQWVDAAPFNIGIITSLTNVSYNAGTAISPSIYFNSDPQTGWFSPALRQQTFVSAGSSILNVNPGGVRVTGVVTATSFVGDGSGLTGAGSTVADDTTTNQTFYPLFTQITSGTVTATKVSTTKFTYNPSTGEASATNFNSTSDESLKTNIHTVENSLNIVDQLRGVSFDWKESGRGSYGVIAQELEQVLPELVTQTDPKSVNYNGIIGVLIEAVKELKKEIEELKNS